MVIGDDLAKDLRVGVAVGDDAVECAGYSVEVEERTVDRTPARATGEHQRTVDIEQ